MKNVFFTILSLVVHASLLFGLTWYLGRTVKEKKTVRQVTSIKVVAKPSAETPKAVAVSPPPAKRIVKAIPKTKKKLVKKTVTKRSLVKNIVKEEEFPPDESFKAAAVATEQFYSDYSTELRHHIQRHQVYPKMAKRLKQEGLVEVKFKVLANGSIKDVLLNKGSGFELIDEASLQLLKSLKKFKPLPAGVAHYDFVVPLHYRLR